MEKIDAPWILHVDGASNSSGCGAGLILSNPNGDITEYALRFSFKVSNNQAEYEALLAGLRIAKELSVRRLKILSDSQLVVNQVKEDFEVHDATLALYLKKVQELGALFDSWNISHVPRT